MRKLGRALAIFAVTFVVAAAVMRERQSEGPPAAARRDADWSAFEYQLDKQERKASQFNVSFRFTDAGDPSSVRALVNCQDEANYYYVQFAKNEVRLGRVEQNFDLRIGTRKEMEVNDGKTHQVVVKRRDGELVAVVDGQIAAYAFDDVFSGGRIGLGRSDDSVKFEGFRFQAAEDVFFTDDFMRDEGDMGPWEVQSGEWSVRSLSNPSLSSNAFNFVGKAQAGDKPAPARAFTGHWFWDNYRVNVACRPLSGAAFGLYFCVQDEDNLFLLRWQSKPQPQIEFVRRREGRDTVVAKTPSGFMPDQWYGLRIDVRDGRADAFVDGNRMLTLSDPSICFGKIGLYTEDADKGVVFDDVGVKSWREFADDFQRVALRQWTRLGGDWNWVEGQGEGASRRFAVACDKPAKAVAGLADWTNYTFSADLGPWRKGEAGLCFHYLDEGNYYACRWRRTERDEVRELVKVVDGVSSVLAQQEAPLHTGQMRVSARVDDGYIRVDVDGQTALEAFDTDLRNGKVGLYARACPFVWFDNAKVEFHAPAEPLASIHEVFSRETSMQIWSGSESDWERRYRSKDGVSQTVNWHRANFHGDVGIEVDAASFAEGGNIVGLIVGAEDAKEDSGYRLDASKADGKAAWKVSLFEGARLMGEQELPLGRQPYRFRLRKAGRFAAAYVDGRCLLYGRSAEPLRGARIAYYSRGVEIARDDVHIYTDHVYNDLFRTAPVDWRVACGTWEVTNRWQCDPRWSFFSGRDTRLAAIWNKRQFAGDLTVEFFAGPKMDRSRGKEYEYASDMNVTICADGQDLTSGYSFLYGGWHNTASAIVRKNAVVARTRSHIIPNHTNIHRRWFHIRAEKRGANLALYIDGARVLTYTDPNPLPGGQMAIWTYDNGLMVSRVRISYEGDAPLERPRLLPPRPQACVYDVVPTLRW